MKATQKLWGGILNLAQVKLERSNEIRQQIMLLCLEQCESPNDRGLLRIGSHLGDFANNLRSALNYTMRRFAESKLKPVLSPRDYKKAKRQQDFPWSDSKKGFDKKLIVDHTKNHYVPVYQFLERTQPYHPGKKWIKHLMRISNRDKHEVINEVVAPNMVDIAGINPDGTPHSTPQAFGDKLLVTSTEKPHVHPLPCYYFPYGAFALKGGNWAFFFIVIDGTKLNLTRFMEQVPKNVEALINDFNALM